MAKYMVGHQRKVRGEQLCLTIAEKKTKEVEMENAAMSSIEKTKEQIENEYLVPVVENWVETAAVRTAKEKVQLWQSLNYPVHIIGPTGCGKTILALEVAKERGKPTVWINGDESVSTTDLIGGYSQIDVTTVRDKYIHNVYKDKDTIKADWIDNPLTLACKNGYTLIYNEFSRSKAAANNILLSIFTEGILELPTQFGEERYVKVHPEFRAIFISNSEEYAGVHRVQDALLDRMVGVYMDYYDKDTEAKIVTAKAKIKENHALAIADMLWALRKKSVAGGQIGLRAGVMVAQAAKAKNDFSQSTLKQLFADVITSKTKSKEHFEKQLKTINQLREV